MKYAHYDELNGQLLGWYDDTIHTTIPIPNIHFTEESWQLAIENNHNKINLDGSTERFDFRDQTEIDAENLIISERLAKETGLDYNGFQIPFTNEDAIAMLQVKGAFDFGITHTNIEFSNGTIMPMTPDAFPTFAS